MRVPAIVTSGDLRAAKAVRGESKPYLELEGRSLVAHVVATLQRVPEVSEVWVVGNAERLEAVFADPALQAELTKPLHVVPQFRNLFENGWQTFRRLLPGAGSDGRDLRDDEVDQPALFLSADIPFATALELSAFVRQGLDAGCDYGLGLVTHEALDGFLPATRGAPGIRMAYFNLREGRYRQSNLHLIRPGRIRNQHYIEEMYEHRYQREFGSILGLAWTLLRSEAGGLAVLFYYALMHAAGAADRRGLSRLADLLRRYIPIARVERGCAALIGGSFRFIITHAGGCAADIDNEADYESSLRCFGEWKAAQLERSELLYGPPALSRGTPGEAEERA
jgi:hypothetical protein